MNSVAPFEPATPAIVVGQSFGGATPPLGLGEPFALLGGDRLGPDGIPFHIMHEHQPRFVEWVAQSCRAMLDAERPWFRGGPLLLGGPPGAGRTHAARWLARVAGVPHIILNLSDPLVAMNIAASRRVNEALWASPITIAMAATRCANPIVSVLGVDKLSDDVAAGLASMIDPEFGVMWSEDQLRTSIDLSEVTWILQCEQPGVVSRTLRKDIELVMLGSPPHGPDTVFALSILLEAMSDHGIEPGDPAYSWERIMGQLPSYHCSSAKALYANVSNAIASLQHGTVAAIDDDDVPF